MERGTPMSNSEARKARAGENDVPPEVLIGALANMIASASQDRDECHDDLRRSWHQGRVSALMDAKRQTESWVAHIRRDHITPGVDQ